MEIKIQCDCGQKFKFDVEPVNGRMPWEVQCPVCGASGTDKANWIISHAGSGAGPLAAPIAPIGSVTSGPPIEAALVEAAGAPPVAAAEPPKARLVIRHHAPAPAAPAQPPVPRPVPVRTTPAVREELPSTNTLFFRGLLGAFVGALVGMGVWYGLTVATGYRIGIVAWGVGALTGFGARLLGRDGNTALGVVSALFAALAIIGGGTLAAHHMLMKELGGLSHENILHEVYVEKAKVAKEAGPLETDAQIKAFLAKREEVPEEQVTAENVASFKKDELEEVKQLASGQMTEEQFIKRNQTETKVATGIVTAVGWVAAFFGSVFSLWTILWLFLGCASAYKIGADAD
jgi:hypothetical protein